MNTQHIDTRYHPDNEIAKYRFFEEMEHQADGRDAKTITHYANAIHEFEVANGFKDFRKYNSDWAITFKNHLNDKVNANTGQPLSKSVYFSYISDVRRFMEWLVKENKDYAKIKRKDIAFLHVTRNDKNKARTTNYQESHPPADILSTIRNMPEKTPIELRNKALLSLLILTTPRISSLQQARVGKIKYLKEYDAWAFIQDPRLQNTKYSRNITSIFIGQSQDIIDNVVRWKECLTAQGFKSRDYLFPKITPVFTADSDSVMKLTKEPIKSGSQLRDIVKKAFHDNGLEYLKPHSFRHSIARMVRKEQDATNILIALAENAGQKNGMATLITSYAGDPLCERSKIIKNIKLE